MNNALAIIIGAVIIAAAILIVFRWQLDGEELLDRWTGTVLRCGIAHTAQGKAVIRCPPD
jgi:hypothetical protein